MSAVIYGPGAANISWTLAFSGGFPVQQFHIEFRRNDSEEWRAVFSSSNRESAGVAISPDNRYHIVHQLEAQEEYVFRVAASNELGRGEFTEVHEPLLSHHIGVPSPPAQPVITGWGEDFVTISTNVPKFGSELGFSLSSVLILNGTQVSVSSETGLPENYSLGEELELVMGNVTYRGDWRFAVLATNYLGSSPLSEWSLRGVVHTTDTIHGSYHVIMLRAARENIQSSTPVISELLTTMT